MLRFEPHLLITFQFFSEISVKEDPPEDDNAMTDAEVAEDDVHGKPSLVAVDNMPANPDSEETPSYFLSYFFALTIICIAGYLILHNKNKVKMPLIFNN